MRPGRLSEALDSQYQRRVPIYNAVVTYVPVGTDGRNIGSVTATIAGRTNQSVTVDRDARLAPGDSLAVALYGNAINAKYYAVATTGGPQPFSGAFQFRQDTDLFGETYGAGDLLFGDITGSAPNMWFDYDQGIMYYRLGTTVNGADYANGDRDFGPPAGVHMHYSAATGVLSMQQGATVIEEFDGLSRTIYGFERLGRPEGPAIEWAEVLDTNTAGVPILDSAGQQQRRFVWRVLGQNGVPVVSIMSGTSEDPNAAAFVIGGQGAENSLEWIDGVLRIRGTAYVDNGNIGGLQIKSGWLESNNDKIRLVTDSGDDFGEGVSMVCADESDSGAVKWFYDNIDDNNAVAIDRCHYDDVLKEIVMVRQVTTGTLGGTTARNRLEVGDWDSPEDYYLELASTGGLRTNAIPYLTDIQADSYETGLKLHGVKHVEWITPAQVCQITWDGFVAKVTDDSPPNGVRAQLLIVNAEVVIPLAVPYQHLGCRVQIDSIGLYYDVRNNGYLSTVKILHGSPVSKTTDVTRSNLGQGAGAAVWLEELLDRVLQVEDAPYALVLTPTNAPVWTEGDVGVWGVRVAWSTI